MSIVSSTYAVGPVQACGRIDVVETHVDSEGGVHTRRYRIALGADYAAIMTAAAAVIAQQLAEEEAAAIVESTP